MSPKTFARVLAAAAVVLVAAQVAHAQAYQGGYYMGSSDNPVGPTVSPYLNLIQNNGVGAVTNYQSLVKPLLNTNAALIRQGSSINYLQQQQQQNYARGVGRGTGHATYFMNYSHFYGSPAR
jgi:hypothetical protein